MMSDYDVTLVDDNTADMYVIFHGPKDSKLMPSSPKSFRPALMQPWMLARCVRSV